jgi:GxxExxY protein
MTVYHKKETALLRELAQNVQHNLGNCLTRDIYMDALEREFAAAGVQYTREMAIPVYYGSDPEPLPHKYTADFVIHGKIIVIVKAEGACGQVEDYALLTLLQATRSQLAVLIQFRDKKVQINRVCCYTKFANSLNNPLPESDCLESANDANDLDRRAG